AVQQIGTRDVVDRAGGLFVGVDEAVPIAERFGESIGFGAQLGVLGVDGPRAADRLEGLGLVDAAGLPELRGLAEDRGLLAGVAREGEALVAEGDEPSPVVGA